MALIMPSIESIVNGSTTVPAYDAQAAPDSTDWAAATSATQGITGVMSGCVVIPTSPQGLSASVGAGYVVINRQIIPVTAASVSIGAVSTTDRRDIVVVNSSASIYAVAGTPNPAGGAGWTRTSTILPPVKPAVPSNACLLGEVYVVGSGATATASVNSGNLVDKTTPVEQGDGWIPDVNTWTMQKAGSASVAAVFTVSAASVQTQVYQPGLKVRWAESGVNKYGNVASVVIAASSASVTLVANSDYAMAATPDTGSNLYSFAVPPDFPAYFNFSAGSISGPTGTITNACCFSINGRAMTYWINVQGTTSSGTGFTFTVPVGPVSGSSTAKDQTGYADNNGTFATGLFAPAANSTTITAYVLPSLTWTAGSSVRAIQGAFTITI